MVVTGLEVVSLEEIGLLGEGSFDRGGLRVLSDDALLTPREGGASLVDCDLINLCAV